MHATREDIETLFDLQKIDLEIKQTNKTLDGLPQRALILTAREKKAGFEAKAVKIAELKRDVVRKITKIDDEDASLAKKEAGTQAAIEAAHGDYRNVEARTKELSGIMRRRETIAADRATVAAELDKIKAMEAQVATALDEISQKESQAIASFQKQGGELKEALARLQAQREILLGRLSSELATTYERTAARSGGVAIGVLDGKKCGSCRMPLTEGRLIDLKNQAPLGICPSCKRLLVIV